MLFKSLTKDNKGPYSEFDFTPYLPKIGKPGKWTPKSESLRICVSGWHGCEDGDILKYLNAQIFEIETRGKIKKDDDKFCADQIRLVRKCNWNDKTARLFACDCAARALKIYEKDYPNDRRPRECITTARRFATGKATLEELAAARAAAWDAAGAASWDAAGAAAWTAAQGAARDAAGAAAWTAGWDTAGDAAGETARGAAWDAAGDAAWTAARNASWAAARETARAAAGAAAQGAAWGAAWDASWDAAWTAGWDAAGDAAGMRVGGAAGGATWDASWDAARETARAAAWAMAGAAAMKAEKQWQLRRLLKLLQ